MSRPSEPEGMVATSIDLSFLPSRMIEPLPKLRSICESAASRAFDLSMDDPSTTRRDALIVALLMTVIRRAHNAAPGGHLLRIGCTPFVLGSQYVLSGKR